MVVGERKQWRFFSGGNFHAQPAPSASSVLPSGPIPGVHDANDASLPYGRSGARVTALKGMGQARDLIPSPGIAREIDGPGGARWFGRLAGATGGENWERIGEGNSWNCHPPIIARGGWFACVEKTNRVVVFRDAFSSLDGIFQGRAWLACNSMILVT